MDSPEIQSNHGVQISDQGTSTDLVERGDAQDDRRDDKPSQGKSLDPYTIEKLFLDNSVDDFLSKISYEELIEQEVYNPEYDVYPPIPDISEDAEAAILLSKLCHKPAKDT